MKRLLFDDLELWKGKSDRKPLILQGARQVGKTHLLKMFGRELFPRVHYFNFEEEPSLIAVFEQDLKPDRLVRMLGLFRGQDINTQSDLVIFDEIQNCPAALTSLKYFHEHCPQLAICCAGSLLGVALAPVSFPVGCVEFLDLHPFSFHEFLLAMNDQKSLTFLGQFHFGENEGVPEFMHQHLWDAFKTYLIVGGLPEVVVTFVENQHQIAQAFHSVRERQTALIRTYLADMAKHSGKENSMHLERLWQSVCEQLARQQDGSAPKFQFKNIIPGIFAYSRIAGAVDWLKKAGLILKTHIITQPNLPLMAFAKENSFKLYHFDVGLLGAMNRLSPQVLWDYDFGTYKGFFVENFVVQELTASGFGDLFAWRSRTAEIEFLLEFENKIIPVEVKSGWVTRTQSLRVYRDAYHPLLSLVLSGQSYRQQGETVHCPLYLLDQYIKHGIRNHITRFSESVHMLSEVRKERLKRH